MQNATSSPQSAFISMHNPIARENQDDPHALPVIGYCPDWRRAAPDDECQERRYVDFIFANFVNLSQLLNFRLYVLTFEDRMDNLNAVLDALIIPGGRDIDPELYGEENTHSEFDKEYSRLRWDHHCSMLQHAPMDMPVLGICQGM